MSYGKIYETTYWGDGRDNTIDWGIVYKDLGVSTDADYQAVLNKGTAEGYTLPSASQQALQNTLVTSLKADSNVWDKLDMLFVFANNGSEEYSLIDWKNPTGTLGSATNTITWVSTDTDVATSGFTGDGVDEYIDTGHLAGTTGTNFTTNSASMGVYSTTEYSTSSTNDYPISSDIGTQRIRFFESGSGGNRFLTTGSFAALLTGASQRGMMGVQKSDSGTIDGLRGDKSVAQITSSLSDADPTTDVTKTVKIFRYSASYGEGNIKLAWVGSKFTETEWQEYVTAVDTYIAAL